MNTTRLTRKLKIFASAFIKSIFLYIQKITGKTPGRNGVTLIVPPTDPGSKGDEAMILGIIEESRRQHTSQKILVVSFSAENSWGNALEGKLDNKNVSEVILDKYLDIGFISFSALRTFYACSKAIVIMADTLDGHYSESRSINRIKLASCLSELGVDVRAVSFSFNRKPTASVLKQIQLADSRISWFPRDPRSFTNLLKYLNSSIVKKSADVSLLLSISDASYINRVFWDTIGYPSLSEPIFIGFNINRHFLDWYAPNEVQVIQVLRQAIDSMLTEFPNAWLVCVPHDTRGLNNDNLIMRDFIDSLDSQIRDRVRIVPETMSAREVKSLCTNFDFSISARMHLALANFSSCVPVIGLPYQDKFDGLFELLEVPYLLCTEEDMFNSNKLLEKLRGILNDRDEYKKVLSSSVPHARTLATVGLTTNFVNEPTVTSCSETT